MKNSEQLQLCESPQAKAIGLRNILLPVDFNQSNLSAAGEARVLGKLFQATVTVLHVSEDSDFNHFEPDAVDEPLRTLRNRLEAFGANELSGVTVSRVINSGDPAASIVAFSERENCDLIVMPAHGYGPARRFLLGSVTAKVLDRAKCPVWTVASSRWASTNDSVKHVVCAVSFDSSAANTVRWAAFFADVFGAPLSVLSVLPPKPPKDVPEWFVSEWNEGAFPGLESRLKRLVEELGVRAEILVDQGDPATALLNMARSKKADLLVNGRRYGKNGCGRLDGTTYAVVRHAPCPVVSI
jgi:nucleotide-binding universal stress UspA family protein